ncbi:MAG: hypothetical protein KatS3mg121_0763 [Gammaproteobacteria bacterium]|nr:MAG: hypothetical protein KatS3mg121_0763 [Gammaproteobacteria bacterium]
MPPEAIRAFCARLGVTRAEGVVDVSMLEHAIREHLEPRAPRRMCVLDPIKLVLTNYPAGRRETLTAPGHPKRDDLPPRPLPFGRELYIDRADFLEAPPKGYKRLSPGARVRLRYGYVIEAEDCVKDEAGRIVEVRARYLPETLGAEPSDGGRPRGVIHWVSAAEHVECEVRLYDRLFKDPFPGGDGRDFIESLNPDSLVVRRGCKGEPALAEATAADRFQFEREGYFCLDPAAGGPGRLVFNRVIALRDGWAKQARRG